MPGKKGAEIWTDEMLTLLFTELRKRAGKYNPDTWGRSGLPLESQGHLLSSNAWHRLMGGLHNDILKQFGFSSESMPKSGSAVERQIKMALCEKSDTLPMTQRNRKIAYQVGFITEPEIRSLERVGRTPRQVLIPA